MKTRKFLSLLLAALMCFGALPLTFGATATEPEEHTEPTENTTDYAALYVQDNLLFRWDAFDIKAGDAAPTVYTNKLDGSSVTMPAVERTGNGFVIIKDIAFNLNSIMPDGDFTLDFSIAQNPDITEASQVVADNDSWVTQIGNMSDIRIGSTAGSLNATSGFIIQFNPIGFGVNLWTPNLFAKPVGVPFEIAIVNDYTASTEENATGGTLLVQLLRDGQNIKQGSTTYTSYGKKCTFGNNNGFAYYAIRLYSKALTEIELQQNHFADLVNYTKANVNGFDELLDVQKRDLFASFNAVTYTTENLKSAIETAVADAVTAKAETEKQVQREALYVQDGLLFRWDAFDLKANGEIPAALLNRESGGTLAYPTTNAVAGNGSLTIKGTLDFSSLVQDGDMTLDMTLAQNPALAGTEVTASWASMNIGLMIDLRINPLNAGTAAVVDQEKGFINNFQMVGWGVAGNNLYDAADTKIQILDYSFLKASLGTTFSAAIVHDYDVGVTEANEALANIKLVRDGRATTDVTVKYTTCKKSCSFGHTLGFAYHTIRLYNKALTEIELQQNHFADLANYAKANVNGFDELLDAQKHDLFASFISVTYTAENLKSAIETAVADAVTAKAEAEKQAQRDALYVQEGLIFRWDAFDLKAGGEVPTFYTNKLDGSSVTMPAAERTGDGFVIIKDQGFNFGALIPRGDFTLDMSLAQNPDIVSAKQVVDDNDYDGSHIGMMADFRVKSTKESLNPDKGFIYTVQHHGGGANLKDENGNAVGFTDGNFLANPVGIPFSAAFTHEYTPSAEEGATGGLVHIQFMRDGHVSTQDTVKYTSYGTGGRFGNNNGFAYYSIRIYGQALTGEQLLQNHFADLVNFARADLGDYDKIADKTALHEFFRTKSYTTYDKATLKRVIEQEIFDASSTIAEALKNAAAQVVEFKGFQVRTQAYPGLRSLYNLKKNVGDTVDTYTVKEVGAIMAIAAKHTVESLTVAKGEDGKYAAVGSQIAASAVSDGNIFIADNGAMQFAFTTVFENESSYTSEDYQTELVYRAYVVLTDEAGAEHVTYIDAVGNNFPDGRVSMYELSKRYPQYETSQSIIQAVSENTLKILLIGNSYSDDASTFLYNVATALTDKEVVIGCLRKGGAALGHHADYALNGQEEYDYKEWSAVSVFGYNEGYTTLDGLSREDWSYITLHSDPYKVAMPEQLKAEDMKAVVDLINANKINADAKIGWHMTWACHEECTHNGYITVDAFDDRFGNQMGMYNAICSTTRDHVMQMEGLSFVIPTGTALQNVRASSIGDNINRDGYHLNDLGKLIAAYTYYAQITGTTLTELPYIPADTNGVSGYQFSALTDEMKAEIVAAINNAVQTPYAVTAPTSSAE